MESESIQHQHDASDVVVGGAYEGDQALEGGLAHHAQAGYAGADHSHAAAAGRPLLV